jgi:hypothetical protein
MLSMRVLIVSPHFPPINAPDHQRVRMVLPHFKEFGWEPVVFAVKPEHIEGVQDSFLTQTLPPDLRIVWSDALSPKWTRRFGIGNLAYRAWGHLKRVGDELLYREKFDLIFFSTTQFPLMALGSRWKRLFNVPYVLDFQDPWWNNYYDQHPEQRPPGGSIKYKFSNLLAKRLEPPTVRAAKHIICISDAYVKTFNRRYPDILNDKFTTLPFGAAESDFEFLRTNSVRQKIFNPHDGKRHWVYVGRGGADMAFSLKAFFIALKHMFSMQLELREKLRIHFIGTNYAPKGQGAKTVEPLAAEFGLGDVVSEITDRIPYFEALQCLLDADALFVPGSDDSGYTASKIYPYILARKPLLAVFHEQSSVVEVLNKTRAGTVVTFKNGDKVETIAEKISTTGWLQNPIVPDTDWSAFEPYTAREMTRRLCEVFDKATK